MDGSSSDRRTASRAPIALKVEYNRLNLFFSDYTRNISKGGTFIKTDRPLDIGTEFLFEFSLPSVGTTIKLTGKVQWITSLEEASEEQPAGMGIAFVFQDAESKKLIEQTVESLMVESLGESLSARLLGRDHR